MADFEATIGGRLNSASQFVVDYLYDMALETSISWEALVCDNRFFRAAGTWRDTDGAASLGQFAVNVMACTVDEVCEKLIARNYNIKIDTIGVYSQGNDHASLTDVTPSIDGCESCCDLLVDEIINFTCGIRSEVLSGGSGSMGMSSSFRVVADSWFADLGGTMSVEGSASEKVRDYLAGITGTIATTSAFAVSLVHSADGVMNTSGSFGGTLEIVRSASGSMGTSSDFGVESSRYTFDVGGDVSISSQTIPDSLGLVEFEVGASGDYTDLGIIFAIDSAGAASPADGKVLLRGCCDGTMPSVLHLRTNLRLLDKLAKFLRVNVLSFPEFTKLTYHRLTNSWRSSQHYVGVNPSSGVTPTQQWIILFEFGCGESDVLNPAVWTVNMFIRVRDTSLGVDNLTRLVLPFDFRDVCQAVTGFDGFTILFNTNTSESFPRTIRPVVFSDEEGLFRYSPLFGDTDLRINITAPQEVVDSNVEVDLTDALEASKTVGAE